MNRSNPGRGRFALSEGIQEFDVDDAKRVGSSNSQGLKGKRSENDDPAPSSVWANKANSAFCRQRHRIAKRNITI